MKYSIKDLKIDLGTTPIENIFINNFLQIADGDYVKVYLYAFKTAYEGREDGMLSEDILAEHLGLDENKVLEAFEFWQDQGLVSIEEYDGEKSYTFISVRELFLGFQQPAEAQEEVTLSNDDDISMTNKEMFDGIEKILETTLTPNEIQRIIDFRTEFKLNRDLVVHGFTYSEKVSGKRNVNYVLTVLRNWALDGILTMKDLEDSEAKNEDKKTTGKTARKKASKKKRSLKKDDRLSTSELNEILQKKLKENVQKAMGGDIEDK